MDFKRFFTFLTLVLLVVAGSVSAATPALNRPFKTDLCTGYREGPRDQPLLWADCCETHDLAMWAGGTSRSRDAADDALFSCVRDRSGSVYEARLMWLGVRIGKLSPIKIPGQQWGNAWSDRVRKSRLSIEEIETLEQSLINESDLSMTAIDQFKTKLERENGY